MPETGQADEALPYCVIGAGPSGLAALKNLRAVGIPAVGFEREDDVGGNWYFGRASSSVYESTRLISSKRMTEFPDFPMPKGFPPYPNHAQALEYLRAYARHFGLYEQIRFQTSVERLERTSDGWLVTTSGGAGPQRFRGVIIANGHHCEPRWPEFPGTFTGELLHAKQYKSPEQLRGRRVLVVGGGNSGCDIAVDAAQHAASAWLSLRRGYHFLPKFLLGTPIDSGGERLRRWKLPVWLVRWITRAMVHVALGPPERYGLPRPDHALFQAHPIVNSQLLYFVGHGAIQIKPDIERWAGDRVRFVDGSEAMVDLVICATGYRVSFPFYDDSELIDAAGRPRLYLNVFHPRYDDLFVVGLIQPNSGLWALADVQSRLVAAFIAAQQDDRPRADWFRRLKTQTSPSLGNGGTYVDSPRHALEIDYYAYREHLNRLWNQFTKRR